MTSFWENSGGSSRSLKKKNPITVYLKGKKKLGTERGDGYDIVR